MKHQLRGRSTPAGQGHNSTSSALFPSSNPFADIRRSGIDQALSFIDTASELSLVDESQYDALVRYIAHHSDDGNDDGTLVCPFDYQGDIDPHHHHASRVLVGDMNMDMDQDTRTHYVYSSCNSDLDTVNCINWSEWIINQPNHSGNGANVVKIPCGECVTLDAAPGQALTGTTLELDAGLDIVGKLVIPDGSDIAINTRYVFVQGELEMLPPSVGTTRAISSVDSGARVKLTLKGTEDITFLADEATDNAHLSGKGVSAKAFVVAGGKVNVKALDPTCPSWVKLQSIKYGSIKNVALNKHATQSSTYGTNKSDAAQVAVDGNPNSFTHTECTGAAPWWQVDLGSVHTISVVKLTNRLDCCGGRLKNFNIRFLDNNEEEVKTIFHHWSMPARKTFEAGFVHAQFVKIQLTGTDCLQLGEVEVMGWPSDSAPTEEVDVLTVGEDAARCWSSPGSRILMTSDTFSWTDQHIVTVADVPSAGPGTISVLPMSKKKTAADETFGYPDFAVEVALLDRSLVIEGEKEDPNGDFAGLGGHFIVLNTPHIRQHLEGALLQNMGQTGKLGRYPLHFHMSESVDGSTLTKNVIYKSNQRCVVIHGSHNVTVSSNVAFDTKGHCYILEDGGEYDNTFSYNLGARTSPLPPNSPLPGETDNDPATFWITNPSNHFIGNVAAGSRGAGFWFELKLRGPSAMLPINKGVNPKHLSMGTFQDNTAHSNAGRAGITTYFSGYLAPPGTVWENIKSYKNQWAGLFQHGTSNINLKGGLLADNRQAARNFHHDHAIYDNVDIIGRSQHVESLLAQGRENNRCIAGGVSFQPNEGMGRGTTVTNCRFSGFDNECTGGSNYALYVEHDQVRNGVFNASPMFSANTFDSTKKRISACLSIKSAMDNPVRNIAFEDADGSLSGKGPGFFVQNDPIITSFIDTPCETVENSCLLFCPKACLRLGIVGLSQDLTTRGFTLQITDGTNSATTPRGHIWFDERQSHINAPIGLALPVGPTKSISFTDASGQPAWPGYATLNLEREPVCAGGVSISEIKFVMPSPDEPEGRCDGDFFSKDDYTAGIYGWQNFFTGMDVVDMDGHYVVKTNRRKDDRGHVSLLRTLDVSCLVTKGGHSFNISGKMRMQDASGEDVFCEGRSNACPKLHFVIKSNGSHIMNKAWFLKTNGDGTWATFSIDVTLPADTSLATKAQLILTDAEKKEFLVTDWSMTRNPTFYEKLSSDSWRVFSGKGFLIPPDATEEALNRAEIISLLEGSKNHIVYRRCNSCSESHQDIFYRRWTLVPATMDLLDLFENNWVDKDNVMNVDFSLYSTYDDAIADTNRWGFCNYNVAGIGFPRNCGPATWASTVEWNSLTSGGQEDVAFFIEGPAPPAISPSPTVIASTSPSRTPSAAQSPTPFPVASYYTAAPISKIPTNLALKGLASASSECWGGYARRTNDGNPNTIAHSCCSLAEWWMVDLGYGTSNYIEKVIIVNRKDCCGGRTREFHVEVLDAEKNVIKTFYHARRLGNGKKKEFVFDDGTAGRFVRVRFNDNRRDCLHLAEVEVWGYPIEVLAHQPQIVEMALNKHATASSQLDGNTPPWKSNDGDVNTIHHSKCNEYPWWKVDLGAMAFVQDVTVTNRKNCCGGRLRSATVAILDEDENVVDTRMIIGAVGNGHVVQKVFNEDTSVGRYVKVSFNRNDCLHMAEVAVNGFYYGTPETDAPTPTVENVALGKPAFQSSTYRNNYYDAAQVAVDGIATTFTHTECSIPNPWWKVDLGSSYTITKVKITNRLDCCGGRLRNFYIRFLNENAEEIPDSAIYNGFTAGNHVDIVVDLLTARFVKVQLNRADCLSLGEVEVMAWRTGVRV